MLGGVRVSAVLGVVGYHCHRDCGYLYHYHWGKMSLRDPEHLSLSPILNRFPPRLLPLPSVQLVVQDFSQQRLRLRFHTGRRADLELCPSPAAQGLFLCLALMAHMLRVPGLHNTPAEGAMPTHEACSAAAAQVEDNPPGMALPKNEASATAEMDEASPASSTSELRPDIGCPPGWQELVIL